MQPLKDIRVVAVTGFLAGPYASMNFARLGAEVIKVELPGKGDPVRGNGPFIGPEGKHPQQRTPDDISTRFLKRNQGVKSVTLNLKHPTGRQMFLDLAKSCDVMLENLAPGSLTRMGLGYKDVSAVNPEIIYCSISGYGQTGEYADRPAHDPQIQGMSGLMEINGHPDGPPTRVGFYIGDLVTPLFACYAILAALREKERTGKGQYLDVSMMDTLTSIMLMDTLEDDVEMGLPLRMGNTTRGGPTGLYRTSDGELTITAASNDQWGRLCNALDAPELLTDARFAEFHSRTANVVEAREEIQKRVEKLHPRRSSRTLRGSRRPQRRRPQRRRSNQRPALLGQAQPAPNASRQDARPRARHSRRLPRHLLRRRTPRTLRRAHTRHAQRRNIRRRAGPVGR